MTELFIQTFKLLNYSLSHSNDWTIHSVIQMTELIIKSFEWLNYSFSHSNGWTIHSVIRMTEQFIQSFKTKNLEQNKNWNWNIYSAVHLSFNGSWQTEMPVDLFEKSTQIRFTLSWSETPMQKSTVVCPSPLTTVCDEISQNNNSRIFEHHRGMSCVEFEAVMVLPVKMLVITVTVITLVMHLVCKVIALKT